jgi:hypothetical protein
MAIEAQQATKLTAKQIEAFNPPLVGMAIEARRSIALGRTGKNLSTHP